MFNNRNRKPRSRATSKRVRGTILATAVLVLLLTACQHPGNSFWFGTSVWGDSHWNTGTWQ